MQFDYKTFMNKFNAIKTKLQKLHLVGWTFILLVTGAFILCVSHKINEWKWIDTPGFTFEKMELWRILTTIFVGFRFDSGFNYIFSVFQETAFSLFTFLDFVCMAHLLYISLSSIVSLKLFRKGPILQPSLSLT